MSWGDVTGSVQSNRVTALLVRIYFWASKNGSNNDSLYQRCSGFKEKVQLYLTQLNMCLIFDHFSIRSKITQTIIKYLFEQL